MATRRIVIRIQDLIYVPVRAGFFADDQAAIRADAAHDGFDYTVMPTTPGFDRVRMPGEATSVLIVLEDGQVAHGDCAAVQYAGVAGREPVMGSRDMIRELNEHVDSRLRGRQLGDFRSVAAEIDTLTAGGRRLHSAVRYGVTQALLDAVAKTKHVTMAEVIRDEYQTGSDLVPVPMFAQAGDDRYTNVDKMILKNVDVLPHGLINNVEEKLGSNGELFAQYVTWVRNRILHLRANEKYQPVLHFDVYGTMGVAFDGDIDRIASYLTALANLAAPFTLRIEHPLDAGSRDGQVHALRALRDTVKRNGSAVEISADEWCNTLEDIEVFASAQAADVIHVKTPDLGGVNNTAEALLLVRKHGLVAYCGGTCNETDRSAQVSTQIAMACGAGQVLARPGMGVDEGLMIVGNEMSRVAAVASARAGRTSRYA